MWKNAVEPYRAQMAIWRMRFACWIPKARNTHSEYVILTTFPQQKWLHESISTLRYTYIARLLMLLLLDTSHSEPNESGRDRVPC
jgi:hypothetical protein